VSAFAPDAQWCAALLERAAQAPLRARVPLIWREHQIGSVESDFLRQIDWQRIDGLPAPLQEEVLAGEPVWRVLGEASASLQRIALALHAAGSGRVVQHWRDEQLAVCNAQGEQLATVERGVVRPLGIATQAVHLVGSAPDGCVWVQQRSLSKANEPGLWDTLMGGMVSAQDSVESALARETWEEAGMRLEQLADLRRGGEVVLRKPSADGADAGYVVERVDWYRCTVPDGVQPLNQDGEVAQFELLDRSELARRLQRDEFTTEAALVLLAALRDGP
jgi:8-oxo-dGTP pyrophosphatase MutT (NUDIX family)